MINNSLTFSLLVKLTMTKIGIIQRKNLKKELKIKGQLELILKKKAHQKKINLD